MPFPEHFASNNDEVFVKLSGDAAKEIRTLCDQFHYSPSEVVRLALHTVGKLMRGKALGQKFLVATAAGEIVQEWIVAESQFSIDRQTQKILEDAFPTSLTKSIADLDPDRC